MPVEIERKFLVDHQIVAEYLTDGVLMEQGYISTSTVSTVRVRIAGTTGYLTIKGKPIGLTRSEFEYEVPLEDAREMLDTLCGNRVSKWRYRVVSGDHTFEIDQFLGDNAGLIVAEVEMRSECETVLIPDWISNEVTGDHRYSNSSLAVTPFSKW